MKERRISLLSMGAGNPKALKKTLESFKGIVDEVVYGDMLIFESDRKLIQSYTQEYNLNIQKLPFNYIYAMGFSSVLNYLASNAKNSMAMYMNTSEVIDEDYGINNIINENEECNAFYFTNRNERHRWHRTYDRKELAWSGILHEEVLPLSCEMKPYHKPIFMMKDEEKDMEDMFKVKCLNSLKEAVYFKQYMRLVENPKIKAGTNEGWVNFAKNEYDSMKQRMNAKGEMITALENGDYDLFMRTIHNEPSFKAEQFESSKLINFQGIRKDIL